MRPAFQRLNQPRLRLCAVAALLLALTPARVQAQDHGMVGEFKLPAGAAVVTAEDHGTRRVVIDTWIAAGSAQDFAGHAGVAAVTARLLWQGGKTALLPGVKALGGDGSLEVDRDFTHFQLRVPATQLEAGIALAGRALSEPDWDAAALEPVTRALAVDLTRLTSDREATAGEAFMAAAYGPDYGHAPVGDPGSVRRLEVGDARAFFARHYLPGRLRVVLAGDLDTGKAVGMAVRSYAAVLKRAAPGEAAPSRPATGTYAWKVPQPVVVAGVKGADAKAPREQAALEMVLHVARTRLAKALGLAPASASVGARFVRLLGPSALILTMPGAPDAVADNEKAVRSVFDELRQNTVRLDEHAWAQVAVANAATVPPKDLAARARGLGFAATIAGDPHWLRTYPEIVRQVSRQDMLEAVQKYAPPDAIKTLVLTP